jgi:hypothetical protein
VSFLDLLTRDGPLMLQGFGISQCCLIKQVLQRTAIVETTAHLRHKLVGNVKSETATLDSTVKHVAGVLFAFEASFAVLADASGTAKTERSQSRWPKACGLFLEPLRDICRKLFLGLHAVYVPHITYTVKGNLSNALNAVICEFRDRN